MSTGKRVWSSKVKIIVLNITKDSKGILLPPGPFECSQTPQCHPASVPGGLVFAAAY